MDKKVIKDIIQKNQEKILELEIISRDFTYEKKANYVIVGPRRAGKTYLLFQIIQERFIDAVNEVLYINFEDERLMEMTHRDFQLILDCYFEIFENTKPTLFFDEIQNVPHWEKFVRRLADEKYQVYITGSNASMLSHQIGTTLGGRFFVHEQWPLSFKEFLRFKRIVLKANYEYSKQLYLVKKTFEEYFRFGGFPEVFLFDNKRSYLSNLFKKVFYGDIIMRYAIQNDAAMQLLVKKLSESVNNETSVNRIKNLIKSIGIPIGTTTVFEYIKYLQESFLIFPVENYIHKFVEKETIKKYYFIDNGLLMLFLHDQDTKLLENLVFLHLYRNYEKIYFYKRNYEIDFYIPDEQTIVQVSYDISDIETEKRELKSIEKSLKELPAKSIYIITYDTEKTLYIKNSEVQVFPLWKWLLKSIN